MFRLEHAGTYCLLYFQFALLCLLEGVILARNRNRVEIKWKFAVLLLGLIITIAVLYQGGRWLERRAEKPETRGDYTQRYAYDNMLEVDGAIYRQRKNITTILLMGIDAKAESLVTQGYRNGGQADFLRLLLVDHANSTITQVQIDRDTMTPISVLGVLGNKSGMRTAQICLAHGFGNDKEQSCELTAEAVSNMLFGTTIDLYLAMNLDGVSRLNDKLGGVTVTLEDDFSFLDPAMTVGTTMTLMGDQAEIYVRNRMNVGVGTNEARMARQEQYISQLIEQVYERVSMDKEFAGLLYDDMSAYFTTNISRGRLINEVWNAREYELLPVVKPEGTYQVGSDGFMQHYVDESALQQIVLELFYEEVK